MVLLLRLQPDLRPGALRTAGQHPLRLGAAGYRLDPCDRLTLPDQKRIRGVQCNLWTEYIADIRHALHMVLPRMAALAETGWANDRKDYNDFVRRIPALVAVYKAEGYNYAPYLFEGIE